LANFSVASKYTLSILVLEAQYTQILLIFNLLLFFLGMHSQCKNSLLLSFHLDGLRRTPTRFTGGRMTPGL
jgi:hypothetical protein